MFYVPFVKKMDILLNGKNGMNFSDSKYVQKNHLTDQLSRARQIRTKTRQICQWP